MIASPFFIVGHERSGTTLMAAALDRHSRIAVPCETHFFSDLCPAAHAQQISDPAFMVDHLFRGFRIGDLKLDRHELLTRLRRAVQPTWAAMLLEALGLYAESRGKELVGEKSPNHWRQVPQILKLFPDSRVIWVVRDGRDTVVSLMKMPWKQHANVLLHAIQWRHTVERMLEFESQFPDRILRVKFEQLVTAPHAEVERVCRFISVDFEPRQLDHTIETGVVAAWELPWKGRVFGPPDPSRIGTGDRELPPDLLRYLNTLIKPTMRQLGYELGQNQQSSVAGVVSQRCSPAA